MYAGFLLDRKMIYLAWFIVTVIVFSKACGLYVQHKDRSIKVDSKVWVAPVFLMALIYIFYYYFGM